MTDEHGAREATMLTGTSTLQFPLQYAPQFSSGTAQQPGHETL